MPRLITQEASPGYPAETRPETVKSPCDYGQSCRTMRGPGEWGRVGGGAWSSGAERVNSKNSEHVLRFGWTKPIPGPAFQLAITCHMTKTPTSIDSISIHLTKLVSLRRRCSAAIIQIQYRYFALLHSIIYHAIDHCNAPLSIFIWKGAL